MFLAFASGLVDPVSGLVDPVSGLPVSGLVDPVSGLVDPVSGLPVSGLVDPVVCVVVNRDFWSSFKALVGLRRRQLLREAAKAFAEAAASGETVWTARQRYMSTGSGSSSDTQEWIVFRDRWNELQRAAFNNRASLSAASGDERRTETQQNGS